MMGTKPEERREYGRSLREQVPFEAHADWSAPPGRADPVQLVEEQNQGRVSWLIPERRRRMVISPFTFYRGSARVMAADLADTPVSGLQAQICGDAHLSNFGAYASPERRLVFDLNDFDETLPGPWEWDIKRLAASFVLACRHNGLDEQDTRKVTRGVLRTYRKAMSKLAEMRTTDIWYSLTEVDKLRQQAEGKKKRLFDKGIRKAMRKDSRQAMAKLTEEVDGKFRIRSDPPFLVPLRDVQDEDERRQLQDMTLSFFEEYCKNVPDHVECLIRQYRPIEVAMKVVGVGSVGTRCFILLLEGRDRSDPLFLQFKQSGPSVLEEHLPASRYRNSGRRVVEGQRLMQTVSDIFLGHLEGAETGRHYYVRQLKDWKASVDVDDASAKHLQDFAVSRGWTLARAHARTGDPVAVASYIGSDKKYDRALTEFACRYADQAEHDHAAFLEHCQSTGS
jgi:uncharacterized protein (DUF2252 family)